MTYSVLVIKNATKEERIVPIGDGIEWGDGSHHWLTEGNFGCDCNRAILFGDDNEECGESRYLIPCAILEDGTRIDL